MLTEDHAIELGNAVANLVGLKLRSGRYNTDWGTKTPLGLGRVIERMYQDHQPTQTDLITEFGIEPVITQI
jgi:hypothetical protein